MAIYPDSPVPASTEAPAGMQNVYADRSNSYASYYMPDVTYRKVGEQELTLQLLLPETPSDGVVHGKYPLLVFVQGSAWRKQNVYANIPQLSDFAHMGYVIAIVEYRASDTAPFPAQLVDTKAAIRYLHANAEKYGVEYGRTAIWGDSSGGHTAIMVGVTQGDPRFDDGEYLEQSSDVQAVIDFYGPTDVTKMFSFPRANYAKDLPDNEVPENILFRGNIKVKPELAQPGNPMNYITDEKELPPVLIMHGDEDEIVPFNQSVLLYNKLVSCQKNAQFYKVHGAMHGYRMWTKPVLDIVADFLKAYV